MNLKEFNKLVASDKALSSPLKRLDLKTREELGLKFISRVEKNGGRGWIVILRGGLNKFFSDSKSASRAAALKAAQAYRDEHARVKGKRKRRKKGAAQSEASPPVSAVDAVRTITSATAQGQPSEPARKLGELRTRLGELAAFVPALGEYDGVLDYVIRMLATLEGMGGARPTIAAPLPSLPPQPSERVPPQPSERERRPEPRPAVPALDVSADGPWFHKRGDITDQSLAIWRAIDDTEWRTSRKVRQMTGLSSMVVSNWISRAVKSGGLQRQKGEHGPEYRRAPRPAHLAMPESPSQSEPKRVKLGKRERLLSFLQFGWKSAQAVAEKFGPMSGRLYRTVRDLREEGIIERRGEKGSWEYRVKPVSDAVLLGEEPKAAE